MFILGLQGSPRRKGNTSHLLSLCMAEGQRAGALTHTIEIDKRHILPCKEYLVCDKKGYCPIDDDMKQEIYALIRRADVIISASPVFFYNVTAQLKALMDRCQTFWARKYRLKLRDPGARMRRGAMLSVAATKGKTLFDAVELTTKYFFDAVDAAYEGSLTYRGVENAKDMANHPTVNAEVAEFMTRILKPFSGRRRVLFACRENACRSQMAGAFAKDLAGDRFEVLTGGSAPADKINPQMEQVMAEEGIDMHFKTPRSIDAAIEEGPPEVIVTMGCGEICPLIPGAQRIGWELPDPSGASLEVMRHIRDDIKKRVVNLINEL
ncbi:MAG: NAD(P)H-dependent oxidoreductase [Pseudomonadota bacterium]